MIANLAFGEKPGLGKVDFHGIPVLRDHASQRAAVARGIHDLVGRLLGAACHERMAADAPPARSEPSRRRSRRACLRSTCSRRLPTRARRSRKPVPRSATHAGMAASSRIDERWIGALVLAPALLDGWRYYHPDTKWATWASRGVKIGMVVMVVR